LFAARFTATAGLDVGLNLHGFLLSFWFEPLETSLDHHSNFGGEADTNFVIVSGLLLSHTEPSMKPPA
jgi:hypothetical protein